MTRLRLILDVSYDPNGCPDEELAARLAGVVDHAVANGLLTGETEAEVEDWRRQIMPLPAKEVTISADTLSALIEYASARWQTLEELAEETAGDPSQRDAYDEYVRQARCTGAAVTEGRALLGAPPPNETGL